MLKKVLLLLCLTAASLQAAMFAGINDRGFDFGLGNDRLNGVLQGDFTYEWIVPNYSGWTHRSSVEFWVPSVKLWHKGEIHGFRWPRLPR